MHESITLLNYFNHSKERELRKLIITPYKKSSIHITFTLCKVVKGKPGPNLGKKNEQLESEAGDKRVGEIAKRWES